MHMADALISPTVGGTFYAAAAGLLAFAARKTAVEPDYEKKLSLMGVLGAFVFAAQMINFSIPGTGSSGHIGGGILLALLLGPYAAFLVISSVLTIQCLFFADGGLLALGCNVFNLGFWPCFVGLPIYQRLTRKAAAPGIDALFITLAVVISLELGALGVVAETLLSGRSELPLGPFSFLMLGIHLPIAVVEGLITAGVVHFVRKHVSVAPSRPAAFPGLAMLAGGALLIGMVLAWFASSQPDGLEWSVGRAYGQEELPAAEQGWAPRLQAIQERTALLPDYAFPATADATDESSEPAWPAISMETSVAGAVGALMTALAVAIGGGGVLAVRRLRTRKASAA